MNFYKILKIKKLGRGSPDFWTRLFAKHTGGGSVKPIINVLTGRLPLTFITSDTKLHDWTIYGNNDVGKNLLDITSYDKTHYAVRWYEDNGQLKASGTYSERTAHSWPRFYVELNAGTYILSGSPDYEQSGVQVQIGTCADNQGSEFSSLGYDKGSGFTFTLQTGSWVNIRVYTAASLYQQTVDLILPLMLRKAGTSEAFEPYQIGVGERTKNLLEITAESQTINGVTFAVDKQAGTVTATRESASSSDAILAIEIPDEVKGQNLYFSGCPSEGSANTYNVYTVDYVTTVRALRWDGITPSVIDYGTSDNEVRYVEGHRSQIRLRIKAGYDAQSVVFKPMLRPANTTSDFIPYGYQIPLITMDAKTAEYVYRNNIFIGDSPLTEGESVSKSSTGLDVKTIAIGADDYPNKLITSLSNVPEMTIKYKTKGGS